MKQEHSYRRCGDKIIWEIQNDWKRINLNNVKAQDYIKSQENKIIKKTLSKKKWHVSSTS